MTRVAITCLFLASAARAADADAEVRALAGTWAIESATLAGRDHTDDFQGMKLVLDGTAYTVDFAKNTDKGTFAVDPAKTPKRIDITSVSGPFKGKTLPGIYELKGDTLTLCLNADGKAELRPAKFEAPEKTRSVLLTYRRDKK